MSIVDYGGVLSPHGIFHEYLDGVQVRSADGIHTPAYAPGNEFAGKATEGGGARVLRLVVPRFWPLIVATDGQSTGTVPHLAQTT